MNKSFVKGWVVSEILYNIIGLFISRVLYSHFIAKCQILILMGAFNESPNFSFLPYSASYMDSTLTPVHKSLNKALLACHKCPKKNRLDNTT